MNPFIVPSAMVAIALLSAGMSQAQPAQGHDPITLGQTVNYLALPTPAATRSKPLDASSELPAWLQAKVTKYEAKAFSVLEDDGTIYTEKDVISSTKSTAGQTTCVQEVASNTAAETFNRFGPGKQDQIVVLRGDMVNICK